MSVQCSEMYVQFCPIMSMWSGFRVHMLFSGHGLQFSYLQFKFNYILVDRNVSIFEYPEFSSVVECACSRGFASESSSNRERFSQAFSSHGCWIGFCARDDFKHSEVKWGQLTWLVFRESMTTCKPALQCTRVERS
jgi:hypothetical protein